MKGRRVLLRSQTNELFIKLQEAGLDAADFELKTVEHTIRLIRETTTISARLEHRATGFFFSVSRGLDYDSMDRYFDVGYSPATPNLYGHQSKLSVWGEVVGVYEVWLQVLRPEVIVPDLWAELAEDRAQMVAATEATAENAPFAPEERRLLAGRMDAIGEQIVDVKQVPPDEAQLIRAEIAELKADLETLNRKQWQRSVVGWVIGIAARFGLSNPDIAAVLHRLFDALRQIGF
jgi:hypothetical protein